MRLIEVLVLLLLVLATDSFHILSYNRIRNVRLTSILCSSSDNNIDSINNDVVLSDTINSGTTNTTIVTTIDNTSEITSKDNDKKKGFLDPEVSTIIIINIIY